MERKDRPFLLHVDKGYYKEHVAVTTLRLTFNFLKAEIWMRVRIWDFSGVSRSESLFAVFISCLKVANYCNILFFAEYFLKIFIESCAEID